MSDSGITGRSPYHRGFGAIPVAIHVPDVRVGPGDEHITVGGDHLQTVAIQVMHVQAVPKYVLVGELDTAIAHLLRDDPARGPVEECARVEPAWATRSELRREIREREPGIDDVFDDHYIASADVGLQVMENAHPTAVRREARERHEVDFDGDVGNGAHEVGQ